MLMRAWLFLGLIVAALSMGGFFYVLTRAGWHPGDPVGVHSSLHHAYLQATTMTFLGMIFGQIGTAFAVRTQRASLRSVGVFSNRYLLLAIAAELALAAVFVFAPPFQTLLGTAALPVSDLAHCPTYPFIVFGADELRRYMMRRRAATASTRTSSTSERAAATKPPTATASTSAAQDPPMSSSPGPHVAAPEATFALRDLDGDRITHAQHRGRTSDVRDALRQPTRCWARRPLACPLLLHRHSSSNAWGSPY